MNPHDNDPLHAAINAKLTAVVETFSTHTNHPPGPACRSQHSMKIIAACGMFLMLAVTLSVCAADPTVILDGNATGRTFEGLGAEVAAPPRGC